MLLGIDDYPFHFFLCSFLKAHKGRSGESISHSDAALTRVAILLVRSRQMFASFQ
jgi:hypothetical protein